MSVMEKEMNKTTSSEMIAKSKIGKVQGAAAFSKGIAVLQLIADASQPPTISQLVKQSGLPRPTLYRLLKALAAEDLVNQRSDKTFAVGTRLIHLAGRALVQNNLVQVAEPELTRLCETTQETAHLAIRSGERLVHILQKDSPKAVRIATSLGCNVPLHATAIGKCMLAFLPEEEREETLDSLEMNQLTRFTKTSKPVLLEEFKTIREQGYAISHQETQLEVECFGAVILDRDGHPIAGVGLSVPLYRMNPKKQVYIKSLLACCNRISRMLGNDLNT